MVDRKLKSGEVALASLGFAIATVFASTLLLAQAILVVVVLNVVGVWWGIKSLHERKPHDVLPATALTINLIISCLAAYEIVGILRAHYHF